MFINYIELKLDFKDVSAQKLFLSIIVITNKISIDRTKIKKF